MRTNMRLAFIIGALVSLLSVSGIAQSFRGSIHGTVTDPSGAVVPGAAVTAKNPATGLERAVVSNGAGEYVIPEIPAGEYDLSVAVAGFQTARVEKILVSVGRDTPADVQLPLHGADTVNVSADSQPLQTTSAALQQVVENTLVAELPLNGRDFGKLVALSPGVTVEASGVAGSEKGFGQFNINGNRDRSNNYLLDGTDNNDPFFNNSALNQVGITGAPASLLPVDAIQEFNLIAQAPAEYGRNSGSTVNILTKSGTNQFHGSALYYLRNSALDARNYFNPDPDPKGGFKNNQYGASLGGPILKDRTFFFVAFEGQRERVTSNYVLSVPTADQRAQARALALANGVSQIQPGLEKILDFFPSSTTGLANGSVEDKNDLDNGILKIDHKLSEKQQLTLRYAGSGGYQEFPLGSLGGYGSGSRLPQFAQTSPTRVDVVSGSLLSTFSPNLLNELRFGYTRYHTAFSTRDAGLDPQSEFGLDMGTGKTGLPELDFSGYIENLGGSAYSIPRARTSQTIEALDNVSLIHGKHVLKFGAEFRRASIQSFNDNLERGLLFFDTENPVNPDGAPLSDDPVVAVLADFYLGYLNPFNFNANTGDTRRKTFNNGVSLFLQDNYRVTNSLTLDLGLRWEYFGPLGEEHGLLANLGTDGLLHQTGQPYNRDLNNFGPRLGLAWKVNESLVVRGGYGLYYDYIPQNVLIANYTASAGLATNPFGSNGVYPLSYNQAAFNGSAAGPVFTSSEGPFSIFVTHRDLVTPYTQSWNLTVQQSVSKGATLDIGYVGSKGTHLARLYDANQNFTNPNYNAIDVLATNAASSYHALQTTLRANNWRGLSGFATYVWSKSLDDASDAIDFNFASAAFPQDSTNLRGEKGASTFDTRHRFTASASYAIPAWNHLPGRLAKGWEANTIVNVQSGRPIPIVTANDTSGTFNFHQRPNLISGVNPILENWNPVTGYLNPAAFQQPADGTFGNLQRNSIYGPGYVNADISVAKVTPITERASLQLRAEIFNVFNHPNYALPSGSITPGVNADGSLNTIGTSPDGSPRFAPIGQITQTPDVAQGNPGLGGGGPRVIQLGLRLTF